MRDFETAFANTNNVAFPNTEAVNATGPSATDGTEFVKIGIDDGMDWGYSQALLDAAGLTPNGLIEEGGNSQKLNAQEILFGISRGYISGLVLSNAADADHDITLSIGEARSETSTSRMALLAALTKQIDANWVAGDNVGGFPSGLALAVDTWYHYFIIKNPTTGVVDAGFDTSLVAANLLTDAVGFTDYKRVRSVLTDGSSNLLGFTQSGNTVLWNTTLLDYDVTNPGTAQVTAPLSVPPGYRVVPLGRFGYEGGNAAAVIRFFAPDQTDVVASISAAPLFDAALDVNALDWQGGALPPIFTDISSQITFRQTDGSASTKVLIATHGWIDHTLMR